MFLVITEEIDKPNYTMLFVLSMDFIDFLS